MKFAKVSETWKKADVNAHWVRSGQVLHVIDFFNNLGAPLADLLKGVETPFAYIKNPHNWLSLTEWYRIIKNCQDSNPLLTLQDWEDIGYLLQESEASYLYRAITNLAGIKTLFRLGARIGNSLNTYQHWEVLSLTSTSVDYRFHVMPSVIELNMGIMTRYCAGIVSSGPRILGEARARTKLLYDCVRLKNIVQIMYSKLNLRYKEQGAVVFIDDRPVAEWVRLETENIAKKEVFRPEYKQRAPYNAIVMKEPLVIKEKTIIPGGAIFNAPYARICARWDHIKPSRRLKNLGTGEPRQSDKDHLLALLNQAWLAETRFFESEKLRRQEHETNLKLARTLKELKTTQKKLEAYSNDLELEVQTRTRKLEAAQKRILEIEKRDLERRITGGFAHEIKNALVGTQLSLKGMLGHAQDRPPAAQIIAQAATRLLASVTAMQDEHALDTDTIKHRFLPHIKALKGIAQDLEEHFRGASEDIERSLGIVDQIGEYAKLGQILAGSDIIDLESVLRKILKRYEKELRSRQISATIVADAQISIRADMNHLDSIFSNLLRNAIDAFDGETKEPKKIECHLSGVRNATLFSIEDNGRGMTSAMRDDIFKPFYSTKPLKGMGLGLCVVQRLVDIYGGQIDFDSQEGRGSVFYITLPCRYNG